MLDIIQAYVGKGHPDAAKRLEVCNSCDLKMKFIDLCGVCGCPVSKKVKTKKKPCPRWQAIRQS